MAWSRSYAAKSAAVEPGLTPRVKRSPHTEASDRTRWARVAGMVQWDLDRGRAELHIVDNNRKPIARLWFNRSKRYLGVFDESKTETRMPIDEVEDIYAHADQLRKTVAGYLSKAGSNDNTCP